MIPHDQNVSDRLSVWWGLVSQSPPVSRIRSGQLLPRSGLLKGTQLEVIIFWWFFGDFLVIFWWSASPDVALFFSDLRWCFIANLLRELQYLWNQATSGREDLSLLWKTTGFKGTKGTLIQEIHHSFKEALHFRQDLCARFFKDEAIYSLKQLQHLLPLIKHVPPEEKTQSFLNQNLNPLKEGLILSRNAASLNKSGMFFKRLQYLTLLNK